MALRAKVTASSTYAGYSADGAIDGVVGGYPGSTAREWASDHEKSGAWVKLSWDRPQTIRRVQLFDRPNTLDQVTAGTLEFSDGASVELAQPLPDRARAGLEICFPEKTVSWVRFTVTGVKPDSPNIGLSEFAAFMSPGG